MQSSPVEPTVTARPKPAHQAAHPAPSASSSDAIDQARFTPGTMLTERYRIVGLLGKSSPLCAMVLRLVFSSRSRTWFCHSCFA
jgi:hypothetical protein